MHSVAFVLGLAGGLTALQQSHYTDILGHFTKGLRHLQHHHYSIWNIIILDIALSQNVERHRQYYL